MASNFQIFSYKTKDSLHLKLSGDFDGSSAHELINKLLEHGAGCYQIFIDTNDLKTIHPFGGNVFENKFASLKKQLGHLLFIGQNGHKFATD
jgi:anti-anti-sigma regulatory factor